MQLYIYIYTHTRFFLSYLHSFRRRRFNHSGKEIELANEKFVLERLWLRNDRACVYTCRKNVPADQITDARARVRLLEGLFFVSRKCLGSAYKFAQFNWPWIYYYVGERNSL